MENSKNSCVFYESWIDAIAKIPSDKDARMMFNAIFYYGAYGIEPELSFPYDSIFETMRHELDRATERYQNSKENGKNGGRPKKWIDQKEAEDLYEKLGTWKAVAQELGVDEDTLRKAKFKWEQKDNTDEQTKNTESSDNIGVFTDM